MVEHLSSLCSTLSSIPSTKEKKERKKPGPAARWHRPMILALRKLRQQALEFKASLDYTCIARPRLNRHSPKFKKILGSH